MVRMDWDRVLSIKAESLTDDEIEDLFPMVIRCDTDDIENINHLRALVKLCQEMLQHKDNQVESLLLECEELKEKVASVQSAPVQNQELAIEQISSAAIEMDNTSRHMDVPAPDSSRDTAKASSDKTRTLLDELESLEEENDILKRKLKLLKEEMEDVTENMDDMTEELEQLRSKNILYIGDIDRLQEKNEALTTQLQELSTQQAEKQRMIDDFSATIDTTVDDWKKILDGRDAEIDRLKEELSRVLTQSATSRTDENEADLTHLNKEIDEGKKIIVDLQEKLLEAATELNESAALIEKLKEDAKNRFSRTGRRKEQRDLLKKIQDANERIAALQNALKQAEEESILKSEQLCQVLGDLRKYENRDRGLAETLRESRELRENLNRKHDHVKDLINTVNNLEMLNSCREMQILALREKLGMSEDETISISGIALKSQEDARLRNELVKKNEALEHQNFEMKTDVRTLRYKLSKLEQKVNKNGDAMIDKNEIDIRADNNVKYHGVVEEELTALRQRAELDEVREKLRTVIDENEALRKGMHEILDCIRDQDGKSELEIHSETLERLLEALDVRHISGWYHPAMRLQERLNVVQGCNSELRSQLKQMRKELDKRDALLHKYAVNDLLPNKADLEDSEGEQMKLKEIEQAQSVYQKDLENCQKDRESLRQENQELRQMAEKLQEQLDILITDLKTLETGDDEMKCALASKSRECTESALNVIAMKRKCGTLEILLNKESAKSYNIRKESIETENVLRKFLDDVEKRNKILSNEIDTLRSNLVNSVSLVEYNELKDKYNEMSIHLRAVYEIRLGVTATEDTVSDQIGETFEQDDTKCFEAKYESSVKQLTKINSELQKQLIDLQTQLSKQTRSRNLISEETNESNEKYEERIRALEFENKSLTRRLEIFQEEIEMLSTTNSLRIFELDSLRHQILDLHAISDDKETIARLGFELNICKSNEVELSKRKVQLENEILHLRADLECTNKELYDAKMELQDCRKTCATRCRSYEDVIDFLRCQYAGSTSLTALHRFDAMLRSVVENRAEIDNKLKEADELKESAKLRKEMLTDRLEAVAKLNDILEEQIGSSNVESIIENFSENSQYNMNVIRLERRINQLENELKFLNDKSLRYQSTIIAMEYEMINIQRTWHKKHETTSSASEPRSETKVELITVCTQTRVDNQSKEVQSEPFDFGAKIVVSTLPEVLPVKEVEARNKDEESIELIKEQLDQALALASERSATLITYESQMIECQAKIRALEKTIAEKNVQLSRTIEPEAERKRIDESDRESIDNFAFKSTISSLRKILDQKEETIERYQNLLKNDRDEHSNAAACFQREIKMLREEIFHLQEETAKRREILPASAPATSRTSRTFDEPIKEARSNNETEEEIARLTEKCSTLEAELNIAKELAERWHRLAEERLQHMDRMRERLEEQHKNELESYRLELNKWQTEADTLRTQLSENRMQLAKGNISLVKELQERDNKIHELSVAYQQLQTECDIMETMTLSQPGVVHNNCSTKMQEMAQTLTRDQANHFQSELDLLRRQIKSQNDKEKMYKGQITVLKERLSRIYMAKKTEERKVSNRETQLERKLKALEEELHETRIQLDREYRLQEAKRVKTAEELALWEKQKKWQKIAEVAKKKLQEKVEEYNKLNANYEKLRAVVLCMEREKWYLRSKLKLDNACFASDMTSPDNDTRSNVVERLKNECRMLRDQVKQLTDQLASEHSRQAAHRLEKQTRLITAREAEAESNPFVDQLERLETAEVNLEKANTRLESENFELRMEIEKRNLETPRLKEKVEHLEKYVKLLKNEKSLEPTSHCSDKNFSEPKKSVMELEKTLFILKRIIEKLQTENKLLKENAKKGYRPMRTNIPIKVGDDSALKRHYELAQKRVVALEADLQLAEQRILMLENVRREDDDSGEIGVLKEQLAHKSALLDKVKQLLTRAALNEKALRQKIQQIELKQTLSTIPECSLTPSSTG